MASLKKVRTMSGQCPTCGGSGFVPDDNDDNEEIIRTVDAKGMSAKGQKGHCGSMQFGLAIDGGRLYSASGYYVFGYPAQLGGRVSPSGYVQANGVAGPRSVYAAGRLRRFQGSGTWAGSGPSGVCSGIWNAAPLRQTF